jgi:MoaA/NifB/PqqE/SkfB family radical SAM enzyme
MSNKIDRVVFQFNDRCPHKCGFCYMPFDRKGAGTVDGWLRILDRVAEFQTELLSFAGGDPCVYKNFYELLRRMEKRSYVNLNSTGYYIQKDLYRQVHHKVDSFCIAFDEVPGRGPVQRYDADDFRRFEEVLDFVSSLHENLTISTLVTPANKDHLDGVAQFLVDKGLRTVTWNLYKFWPFEFIEEKERYALADEQFRGAIEGLSARFAGELDIRGWYPDERKTGYFFVTSLGAVYTVDRENANRYAFIGSIFDDAIYDRWLEHNTPDEVATKFHQIADREITKSSCDARAGDDVVHIRTGAAGR